MCRFFTEVSLKCLCSYRDFVLSVQRGKQMKRSITFEVSIFFCFSLSLNICQDFGSRNKMWNSHGNSIFVSICTISFQEYRKFGQSYICILKKKRRIPPICEKRIWKTQNAYAINGHICKKSANATVDWKRQHMRLKNGRICEKRLKKRSDMQNILVQGVN